MLPCVDSPAVISCHSFFSASNAADHPREVWVPLWTLASHLSVPMRSNGTMCAIPSPHPQPFEPVLILPSGFPLTFMKKPLKRHRPQALTLTVNTGAAWLCDSVGHHSDLFCDWAAKRCWTESEINSRMEVFSGMDSP